MAESPPSVNFVFEVSPEAFDLIYGVLIPPFEFFQFFTLLRELGVLRYLVGEPKRSFPVPRSLSVCETDSPMPES